MFSFLHTTDFANLQESVPGSKLPSKVPDDTSEAPDIDYIEWKDEIKDDELTENDPEGDSYFIILWNKLFLHLGSFVSSFIPIETKKSCIGLIKGENVFFLKMPEFIIIGHDHSFLTIGDVGGPF